MIKPEAIEPWTAQMLFLQNRLGKNDSPAANIVNARIQMLKSQLAYYFMVEVGEKGRVNMTLTGEKYSAKSINCADVKSIAKTTGLLNSAYKSWTKFLQEMDKALNDEQTRELIGTGKKKPKFYESAIKNLPGYVQETINAVKNQCGVEIVVKDK